MKQKKFFLGWLKNTINLLLIILVNLDVRQSYLYIFDMNDIGYEEISVQVENNVEVAIFDRDNWKEQNESMCVEEDMQSLKLIQEREQLVKDEKMKMLEKEL